MAWAVTADPMEFDEAQEWFRNRIPVTPELELSIGAAARDRAWWVSGVTQLDVLLDVFRALDHTLKTGGTIQTFRRMVREKLVASWGREIPGRLDTIFRTNTQTAYNRGRWEQLSDPTTRKLRPFLMFDAILDARTTRICQPLDGTLLPAEDEFWLTHNPPLHYSCRSSLRSLSKPAAERRGGVKPPPPIGPGEGEREGPQVTRRGPFGKVDDLFRPALEKYPPELKAIFDKKIAAAAPPPKAKPEHLPSHWEEHYRSKYGAAAGTVAHGRAAQEWALDQPLEKSIEALFASKNRPISTMGNALRAGQHLHPNAKTGRELVELLRADGPEGQARADRIEAALAIHGHTSRLKAHKPGAIEGMIKGKPRDKAGKPREKWDEAVSFYETLLSRDLGFVHGGYGPLQIKFSESRGSYRYNHRIHANTWSPGVLVHEMGHALESYASRDNEARLAQSVAFLKARTVGERLELLSKLTGRDYGAKEKARPDKFIDPYAGKDYSRGDKVLATEILSMGTEWLSQEPIRFYREDPEMFWFTLGQLSNV